MEQFGLVVELDGDNAIVRFKRNKACEGCGACIYVGDTDAQVTLANTLGAEVGDRVRVELHAKKFLQANFLAYGFPLVLLVAGAAAGSIRSDTWGAVLGLAGALLGFLALRLLEPRFARKKIFQPHMISIEYDEP